MPRKRPQVLGTSLNRSESADHAGGLVSKVCCDGVGSLGFD